MKLILSVLLLSLFVSCERKEIAAPTSATQLEDVTNRVFDEDGNEMTIGGGSDNSGGSNLPSTCESTAAIARSVNENLSGHPVQGSSSYHRATRDAVGIGNLGSSSYWNKEQYSRSFEIFGGSSSYGKHIGLGYNYNTYSSGAVNQYNFDFAGDIEASLDFITWNTGTLSNPGMNNNNGSDFVAGFFFHANGDFSNGSNVISCFIGADLIMHLGERSLMTDTKNVIDLTSSGYNSLPASPFNFKCKVTGNILKAYINNVEVASATLSSSAPSSGKVGLYADVETYSGSELAIDNISIIGSSFPNNPYEYKIIAPEAAGVGTTSEVRVNVLDRGGKIVTSYNDDIDITTTGAATGAGAVNISNGTGTINIGSSIAQTTTLGLSNSQGCLQPQSESASLSFVNFDFSDDFSGHGDINMASSSYWGAVDGYGVIGINNNELDCRYSLSATSSAYSGSSVNNCANDLSGDLALVNTSLTNLTEGQINLSVTDMDVSNSGGGYAGAFLKIEGINDYSNTSGYWCGVYNVGGTINGIIYSITSNDGPSVMNSVGEVSLPYNVSCTLTNTTINLKINGIDAGTYTIGTADGDNGSNSGEWGLIMGGSDRVKVDNVNIIQN